MNRQDFLTKSKQKEPRQYLSSKILDMGKTGTKKVLMIKVHSGFNGQENMSMSQMRSLADLAEQEMKAIGCSENIAVFIVPDNIDMSLIDLEEPNGKGK